MSLSDDLDELALGVEEPIRRRGRPRNRGAGSPDRTDDLPLTRRLLYQLSYAGSARNITRGTEMIAKLSLIRLPEVKARTGLSRSEIYRRIQNSTFPANVKIGPRASAWVAEEIDQWIADQVTARDTAGGA